MVWAQDQRRNLIAKVMATLRKVKKEDLILDKEALIAEIMGWCGSTKKKAEEYVREAEWLLSHAKEPEKQEDNEALKVLEELDKDGAI